MTDWLCREASLAKKFEVVINPPYVDFEFLLPLHAHALNVLTDNSFIGSCSRSLRRRALKDRKSGIIFRTIEDGAAQHIARSAVNSYFDFLSDFRFVEHGRGYHNVFRLLKATQIAWFTSSTGRLAGTFKRRVEELEQRARRITSAEQWCELAIGEAALLLEELATSCRRSVDYSEIRSVYGAALADRFLHDRQMCAYLAAVLVRVAPSDRNGFARSFVTRTRIPNWARRIVIARDRGKCACCGVDIAMELLAKPHIDHIIPLAVGGCNDLVNLQLMCEDCNLKKACHTVDIQPSIPCYQEAYFVGQGYDEYFP